MQSVVIGRFSFRPASFPWCQTPTPCSFFLFQITSFLWFKTWSEWFPLFFVKFCVQLSFIVSVLYDCAYALCIIQLTGAQCLDKLVFYLQSYLHVYDLYDFFSLISKFLPFVFLWKCYFLWFSLSSLPLVFCVFWYLENLSLLYILVGSST